MHGFCHIAAVVPELRVANPTWNVGEIIRCFNQANAEGADAAVFPELCVTGYTCADLFFQSSLHQEAEKALRTFLSATAETHMVALLGMPLWLENQLYNTAVVIQSGRILGVVPKTFIPNYGEFYEARWFAPASRAQVSEITVAGQCVPFGTDLIFEEADGKFTFGTEICEDLWVPEPPSGKLAVGGAEIIMNLSASNELIGKEEYRTQLVAMQSARLLGAYVYASAGVHESTTDLVFSGHALISENGVILSQTSRFEEHSTLTMASIDISRLRHERMRNTSMMAGVHRQSYRKISFASRTDNSGAFSRWIDPHPFVPGNVSLRDARCHEIFQIQTSGLAKRLRHTGMKKAVIGISGGLDSTLALLVTARAFDRLEIPRSQIIAITMPGFGTTGETYRNACELVQRMGAELREVDIRDACLKHFADIGHDPAVLDVTYENVQARERTQVLMDVANKNGGLVIGTGDLSEMALGWCTYNGDHMSMYAVNTSVPKTLVRYLVGWVADHETGRDSREVLCRILDTPISPELLPPDTSGNITQKTEDIVGPYELHDFFLYHMVRCGAAPDKILYLALRAFEGAYSEEIIRFWLRAFIRRFFMQQFKRSCIPDGPKVGSISLSPRGDWRMPSDAEAQAWLDTLG